MHDPIGLFTTQILLFKFIEVLFPTSDFSHPVATPAVLFMGELLSKVASAWGSYYQR